MLFNYKNILLLNFTILILGCKQSIKEPIIKNDKKETELLLKKSSSKNIQIVPIVDIETHIKN